MTQLQPTPPQRPGLSGEAVFGLILLACGVLVGVGLYLCLNDVAQERRLVGAALLGAGTLGAVCSALAFALAARFRAAREASARHQDQLLTTITERLSSMSVMLNVVTEQQLISDRAKAVAYREKERETLRRAIREELGRGDWEAARVLVDEMEATFGYRGEAERLRTEISDHRNEGIRRQMLDAQERIDRMCRAEDWQGAQQEASRFIALYADYEPARRLPADIESRRQAYKKQLLDRWNDCVLRHDGDAGVEVLRLLDPYLTPAEGERMQEAARSIFNDRKARIREHYSSAVARRDWPEAIRLTEVAAREFPNARFTQEMLEALDSIRARQNGTHEQQAEEAAV